MDVPRSVGAFALLVVGSAAAIGALPGRGILYGSDGRAGNLLTIDPATGIGSVVGPIAAGQQIRSLATDPATGILYAGTGGNASRLYRVDPVTGAGTLVGDTGLGKAMISAMDFGPDGRLYASVNLTGTGGTGGDHLATIATTTGTASVIGAFGACTGVTIPSTGEGSCSIEGIEGLAFDAAGDLHGVLRGSDQSSGAPGLYLIDPATAQATFAVAVRDASGEDVLTVALQGSCAGTLYGGAGGAGSPPGESNPTPPKPYAGFLSTITPATGVVTFPGISSATGGVDDLSGLAFAQSCGVPTIPALSPLPLGFLAALLAAAGWLTLRLVPAGRA